LCANSLKRDLNFLGNLGYLKSFFIDIFVGGHLFLDLNLSNNTSLFCSVENTSFYFQQIFAQIYADVCPPLIIGGGLSRRRVLPRHQLFNYLSSGRRLSNFSAPEKKSNNFCRILLIKERNYDDATPLPVVMGSSPSQSEGLDQITTAKGVALS